MKLIIEDIGNYRFAIIIKNDSGRSYNFVEWADSLQDGKSTAREYYDSDFYHRTHSEYWLYDTKKHRAYLPQGFISTDQKFNDSLPIYKEDDEGRYELLVDYVNDKIYGMKESVQPDGNSVRKAWAEKLGVDPKLLRSSCKGNSCIITISALNMFSVYEKGLSNKDIEDAGNDVIKEMSLNGKCYITDLGNYSGAKLKFETVTNECMVKESAMLIGWNKVEDICNNFRFTGDWFKDLHKLWDRLDKYYYNEVEVYNENIIKRIKDKVTEVIISKYPEFEEEIKEEIW